MQYAKGTNKLNLVCHYEHTKDASRFNRVICKLNPEVENLVGASGTGYLFDSTGLHRLRCKTQRPNYRLMLHLNITPGTFSE